jgi:hypothetical protein
MGVHLSLSLKNPAETYTQPSSALLHTPTASIPPAAKTVDITASSRDKSHSMIRVYLLARLDMKNTCRYQDRLNSGYVSRKSKC